MYCSIVIISIVPPDHQLVRYFTVAVVTAVGALSMSFITYMQYYIYPRLLQGEFQVRGSLLLVSLFTVVSIRFLNPSYCVFFFQVSNKKFTFTLCCNVLCSEGIILQLIRCICIENHGEITRHFCAWYSQVYTHVFVRKISREIFFQVVISSQ